MQCVTFHQSCLMDGLPKGGRRQQINDHCQACKFTPFSFVGCLLVEGGRGEDRWMNRCRLSC